MAESASRDGDGVDVRAEASSRLSERRAEALVDARQRARALHALRSARVQAARTHARETDRRSRAPITPISSGPVCSDSSSTLVGARAPPRLAQSTGDGLGGGGLTLLPTPNEQYSRVVIFLHGLGAQGGGWAAVMRSLATDDTKYVLPAAEERPVTLSGGKVMPAWADVTRLRPGAREDRDGFDATAARIEALVQRELSAGVSASSIVVAGYSQGGAAALHYSLRCVHALGACMAFSAWLPLPDDYPAALSPASALLPVLMVHGLADAVVAPAWAQASHSVLAAVLTHAPRMEMVPGMGHAAHPRETQLAREFLAEVFRC